MIKRVVAALAAATVLVAGGCHRRPARVVFGVGMTSNAHAAVTLAVREINRDGGIGGVPLEVVGLESRGLQDEYQPVNVIKLADYFIATEDLVAVIGHSDSASTLSAAAAYNKHGLPQIVTIATNPGITNIGSWTYRLCLSDAAQGPALADYAVRDWQKRRIAMFYVNDDYGRGLAGSFEQRVRELGATVVTSVMHHNALQQDDKDVIVSTLSRLAEQGPPDLIALFQRVQAATWTMSAIRGSGLDVDILGGDNLAQFDFAEIDPRLTSRVRVSQFYSQDGSDQRAAAFARSYKSMTGSDPDYGHAFAYDAVYLLRDAVLEGGYSRKGVKAYLDRLVGAGKAVRGVAGPYRLGADHDARRALHIARIAGRKFEVIKTLGWN